MAEALGRNARALTPQQILPGWPATRPSPRYWQRANLLPADKGATLAAGDYYCPGKDPALRPMEVLVMMVVAVVVQIQIPLSSLSMDCPVGSAPCFLR